MNYTADTLYEFTDYDPADYEYTAHGGGEPSRKVVAQRIVGGLALAWITLACGWTLSVNLMGPKADVPEAGESVAIKQPPAELPPNHYVELFDPTYSLGYPAATFVAEDAANFDQRFALATNFEQRFALTRAPDSDSVETQQVVAAPRQLAQSVTSPVPLPMARPIVRNAPPLAPRDTQGDIKTALAAPTGDEPTLLQKLFGKMRPFAHDGATLAFAPSDGGLSNDGSVKGAVASLDQYTAVYDISAHMVYMPDGTKLEAHSGLGNKLDDPTQVHVRMRGATPPHVYDLSLRESLFHGVQALRLKPLGGEEAIFGRSGLLAHTYMLGPNGDSNGCVSFKNYEAFLQAYQAQKVKRLMVVAKL